MVSKKVIDQWKNGIYTNYGLYSKCETDEEFYDILKKNGYDNSDIKLIMRDVSGADDAYNTVISQKEIGVKVKVGISYGDDFEHEVEVELWFNGEDFDDFDDDEELDYKIEDEYEYEVSNNLTVELLSWERIKENKDE